MFVNFSRNDFASMEASLPGSLLPRPRLLVPCFERARIRNYRGRTVFARMFLDQYFPLLPGLELREPLRGGKVAILDSLGWCVLPIH